MAWVDTHCHLQLDEREPAALLGRADLVDWLVAPGVDATTSIASVALADQFPGRVLATAGLHPHDASKWSHEKETVVALAPLVAAIGETGLDFYRNLSPREDQEHALREQLELARLHEIPTIVHCRDAFSDVFRILEETGAGPRVLLHSWTGGTRWTKRFLELGVMFSFSGTIAFDTAETIRLGAALVPPGRAVVETDTPYLTPPPHRGKPNEPAWVALVGEALARVWGLAVDDVAEITSANAARVFGR